MNSLKSNGSRSPESKLKHRCREVQRMLLRAQEEWKCGKRQITLWSVNHLREIDNAEVIKKYLTSPHEAVGCTIKLQKNETSIKQLKCQRSYRELVEAKQMTKTKQDRKHWDLKQDFRYFEEGIDDENTL